MNWQKPARTTLITALASAMTGLPTMAEADVIRLDVESRGPASAGPRKLAAGQRSPVS